MSHLRPSHPAASYRNVRQRIDGPRVAGVRPQQWYSTSTGTRRDVRPRLATRAGEISSYGGPTGHTPPGYGHTDSDEDPSDESTPYSPGYGTSYFVDHPNPQGLHQLSYDPADDSDVGSDVSDMVVEDSGPVSTFWSDVLYCFLLILISSFFFYRTILISKAQTHRILL